MITKFSRHEWYWTLWWEDLFTASPEQMYFYRLIIKEIA